MYSFPSIVTVAVGLISERTAGSSIPEFMTALSCAWVKEGALYFPVLDMPPVVGFIESVMLCAPCSMF